MRDYKVYQENFVAKFSQKILSCLNLVQTIIASFFGIQFSTILVIVLCIIQLDLVQILK